LDVGCWVLLHEMDDFFYFGIKYFFAFIVIPRMLNKQ